MITAYVKLNINLMLNSSEMGKTDVLHKLYANTLDCHHDNKYLMRLPVSLIVFQTHLHLLFSTMGKV